MLKIGKFCKEWYESKQTEQYVVETINLDQYYKNVSVDVLWIDIQGAEKLVLLGALETLKTVKAVFIGVTSQSDFYEGSATFQEISKLLEHSGFSLALLGMDYNLTGNALFLKQFLE